MNIWKAYKLFRAKGWWTKLCLLKELHDRYFMKWIRLEQRTREYQEIYCEMRIVRKQQHHLAAKLGITDAASELPVTWTRSGSPPPLPKWIEQKILG